MNRREIVIAAREVVGRTRKYGADTHFPTSLVQAVRDCYGMETARIVRRMADSMLRRAS